MKTNQMFSPLHNFTGAGWSEVTSGERNQIVFERLNKTYGAYEIRTNYDRTLLKSFSATALFITLFSVYIFISGYFSSLATIIPIPFDPTVLKPILDNEKPIIPDEPKTKATSSPKTKEDTEPEIKDESEKDEKEIILKNPNANLPGETHSDTGSSDPPLIPTRGGEKFFDEDTTTHDALDGFIELPRFPGGDDELYRYLKNNLHIPEVIKEMGGIKEKVGVHFIIGKDGSITGVALQQKCKYTELNNEAMRVIKKMPNWEPGRQNGNPVKVRLIIPLRFEVK